MMRIFTISQPHNIQSHHQLLNTILPTPQTEQFTSPSFVTYLQFFNLIIISRRPFPWQFPISFCFYLMNLHIRLHSSAFPLFAILSDSLIYLQSITLMPLNEVSVFMCKHLNKSDVWINYGYFNRLTRLLKIGWMFYYRMRQLL